jgi:hypothetical protein
MHRPLESSVITDAVKYRCASLLAIPSIKPPNFNGWPQVNLTLENRLSSYLRERVQGIVSKETKILQPIYIFNIYKYLQLCTTSKYNVIINWQFHLSSSNSNSPQLSVYKLPFPSSNFTLAYYN